MKKTLTILAALLVSTIALTACHDDNESPQVNISFTYGENVRVVNSDLYIVKGEDFSVESINCEAVRPNTVAVVTGPVNYWLDGMPLFTTGLAPFKVTFSTTDLVAGRHTLTVQMGIAEEGCALGMGVTQIGFNVVTDATEIPTPSGDESQTQPVEHTMQ